MEEDGIALNVVYNVDLVEDDARVQHIERRVVERACEHDILEELEAVGVVNLLPDKVVSYWNRLVEMCIDVKKFAVIGLVCGKLWIVWIASQNQTRYEGRTAYTRASRPLQRICRPREYARKSRGRSSSL